MDMDMDIDLDICMGMYLDMDTDMNLNMDMGFSSDNPVTFGRFLKANYRERKHSSNRPPVTINLKGATHLTRKHNFFSLLLMLWSLKELGYEKIKKKI